MEQPTDLVHRRFTCVTCRHETTLSVKASSRGDLRRITCPQCGGDRHRPIACCHIPGGDPVCILPMKHDGRHDHGHGKGNQ